jgi:hypothetical protein
MSDCGDPRPEKGVDQRRLTRAPSPYKEQRRRPLFKHQGPKSRHPATQVLCNLDGKPVDEAFQPSDCARQNLEGVTVACHRVRRSMVHAGPLSPLSSAGLFLL